MQHQRIVIEQNTRLRNELITICRYCHCLNVYMFGLQYYNQQYKKQCKKPPQLNSYDKLKQQN